MMIKGILFILLPWLLTLCGRLEAGYNWGWVPCQCRWDEWNAWSDCTSDCFGTRVRDRKLWLVQHDHCDKFTDCATPDMGKDRSDCNNVCHNGGSLSGSRCNCRPGYIGRCCISLVNHCVSQPCHNNGTCTDLLDAYECTCTKGWGGANCQKDMQPPVVTGCLSNFTVNATELIKYVNWTEPTFTDPLGNVVNVVKNYNSPGFNFSWGDFTVQYVATKPSNGLQTECRFTISVRPTPAPHIIHHNVCVTKKPPRFTTCRPSDLLREYYAPAGRESVAVTWTVPTATDDDGTVQSVQQVFGNPRGGSFEGSTDTGGRQHTIMYEAKDNDGLIATCYFAFKVRVRTCGALSWPANGIRNCPNGQTLGRTCTYSCNRGYQLSGPRNVTCQGGNSSSWSAEPTCKEVSCGSPPSVKNGSVTCAGTTYGSYCRMSCETGFGLEGQVFTRCQHDGTWFWVTPTRCRDSIAPVITCTSPQIVYVDRGMTSTSMTWKEPTATDNQDPNPVVSKISGPAQGVSIDVGRSQYVVYRAKDADRNNSPQCAIELRAELSPTAASTVSSASTYTPAATAGRTEPNKHANVSRSLACVGNKFLVSGPYGVGDEQLSQSSYYNNKTEMVCPQGRSGKYARLNSTLPCSSWSSGTDNPDDYVQVDFRAIKLITGVVIAGRIREPTLEPYTFQYVTSFRVLYSVDCMTFAPTLDGDGNEQIFGGCKSVTDVVTNCFQQLLSARCVRINPTTYSGWKSLRFDILGH